MLYTIVSILAASVPASLEVSAMQASSSCAATCNSCINTAPFAYSSAGSAANSATALHSCTTSCSGCMDVYCDHSTIELKIEKCNSSATIAGIANTPNSPYANFWLSCSLCNAPPITVEQTIPAPAPPPPPPPPSYTNTGRGQCATYPGGGTPLHSYHHAAGSASCMSQCNNNPSCCGYSVSSSGNCLNFNQGGITVNTGRQWGNADCNVKTSNPTCMYSPVPVASPPPPAPPPLVHVMPGWCNNWNHGDWPADSPGERGYGNTANQAECFAHCDANPYCQQAVFESGGQWGNECWLGTNAMVQTPRAARGSCTGTPGCINNCYNRVGWPAA